MIIGNYNITDEFTLPIEFQFSCFQPCVTDEIVKKFSHMVKYEGLTFDHDLGPVNQE